MKYFLFFLTLALAGPALAQNGIYNTYEDYKANKLMAIDAYDSFKQGDKITFKKDKKKQEFDLGEVWGFVVNGELYRAQKDNRLAPGVAYVVISNQRMVHYEIAEVHQGAFKRTHSLGSYEGPLAYVSKDLESKIVPLTKFSRKKVKQEIPDSQPLLDCIDAIDDTDKDYAARFRKCVDGFQKQYQHQDLQD